MLFLAFNKVKVTTQKSPRLRSLNASCFLHLPEIVEELSFHCSLSVCLSVCVCVCVSVCPEILVNEIPAERMHRFGRGFC